MARAGDKAGDNAVGPLLLFVCAGNICRSPMAQAIAADLASREGRALRVASAGMSALEGHEATELTRAALADAGIAIEEHRARQLTREMIAEAALVVTATRRQCDDLRYFFRTGDAKIRSFAEMTGLGDLADPYGAGPDAFAALAALIRKGMPSILEALRERM